MLGLKFTICSLFILGALHSVTAQDDLVALLQKSVQFYEENELDSAWDSAVKAEKISRANNYTKGIIQSKIVQTNVQIDKDKLTDAEKNATEALNLSKQTNDKYSEAVAQMQLGQIHLYRNQFDKSLPYFEKSIQNYFSKHHSPEAALAYNDYGYSLGKLGKLELQIESLLNALRIHEKLKSVDNTEMAVVLNNLSMAYLSLGQSNKAIEYAKQSIGYREKSKDVDKMALAYCNISQMSPIQLFIEPEIEKPYLHKDLRRVSILLPAQMVQRISVVPSTKANLHFPNFSDLHPSVMQKPITES